MRTLFAIFVLMVLGLAQAGVAAESAMPNVPETDPVLVQGPPFRRLFLDAMVVEESGNLDRVFHQVEKYKGNPIIVKDRPWEGSGPYIYGTVMWDDGKLKMWYQIMSGDGADVAYAESHDGIHWVKPNLGVIKHHGSDKNNIIAVHGAIHVASVIRLPKPTPDGMRWAIYGYAFDDGAAVAYSKDGLRWQWKRKPAQKKLFNTSDVTNFFYDPYRKRFVATFKLSNRRHRAVGVALSDDGLKWRKPINGPVFGADDLDPDPTQIYGMPVFPYQGVYIGLPWIYHARWIKYGKYTSGKVMEEAERGSPMTVDTQLAWSWDLIGWTRTPERKPFIPMGPEGAWDSKLVYTAQAPVQVGDKLYFYYSGFAENHQEYADSPGAIGLATLRLDGFCSMHAGDSEGWLISRREVFNTPKVTINAKCGKDGYVIGELVDRDNNVIPGFSRDDCVPFTGDSVRAELTWKTGQFPKELIDKDRKVRFYLKNADLYSYLPVGINEKIDDSHPD